MIDLFKGKCCICLTYPEIEDPKAEVEFELGPYHIGLCYGHLFNLCNELNNFKAKFESEEEN